MFVTYVIVYAGTAVEASGVGDRHNAGGRGGGTHTEVTRCTPNQVSMAAWMFTAMNQPTPAGSVNGVVSIPGACHGARDHRQYFENAPHCEEGADISTRHF
jgi:hypothetical protein